MRFWSAMHDEMPSGNIEYIGTGVTRYVDLKDGSERAVISSFCGAPERSVIENFLEAMSGKK